jgi:hypothetical protein
MMNTHQCNNNNQRFANNGIGMRELEPLYIRGDSECFATLVTDLSSIA